MPSYRRELDLDGSVASVSYTSNDDVVATYDGAQALMECYRADGRLHRNQAVRLNTHLANAEQLAEADVASGAAKALDRYEAIAEEVTDETARGQLHAYADALGSQL